MYTYIYLRRNDRLSRNARKVRAAALEAQEHLAQQLGRHPQDSEIAELLGISTQTVRDALRAQRTERLHALEAKLSGRLDAPVEEAHDCTHGVCSRAYRVTRSS